MSEVIVRMEMPKNCPCELSAEVFDPIGNYGGHQPCFAWYGIPARSKEFDRCVVRSERPAWCPIIGVLPEQHGRLVDASTVLFAADDSEGVAPPMPVTVDDYLVLFDLPTIVPATERSEYDN